MEKKLPDLQARNRGFTLLLAALVASITLALGASIYEIAQKEVTLSSVGRDSQYAFYAADTAAECALYWDSRYQSFPTSTLKAVQIMCDGQTRMTADSSLSVTVQGSAIVSSFQFEPNGNCATVTVSKISDVATGNFSTLVHADGFNTVCDVVSISPRALQRSVELHY